MTFVLAAALSLIASAPSRVPVAAESPVDRFFEAWAAALSAGDAFDTARFYTPDVALRSMQPDLEKSNLATYVDTTTNGDGRAWLVEWLSKHTNPHTRSVEGLFVDGESALVIVAVDDLNTGTAMLMDMGDAGIAGETMLRWRDAHKRGGAPDRRLAWLDDLIAGYVAAWSTGDPGLLSDLYLLDAVAIDADGRRSVGREAIIAGAQPLPGARVAGFSPGDEVGTRVFVNPGPDTSVVAFVLSVDATDRCEADVAVALTLEGGRVIEERRFVTAGAGGRCLTGGPSWWTGLDIPPPIDQKPTGAVAHPDGHTIPVYNGTPELERLASWGLDRFAAAGLDPPQVESITFAPDRSCGTSAGAVAETDGGSPNLLLCTDAYSACRPDRETCLAFAETARFGMLHELAHVWLLEHLDDAARTGFLAATGLSVWRGDVPWHERGVELAADTLAWGLMDERIPLIRFDNPTCASLSAWFELLTGLQAGVPC